ncbi:MAG TPA: BON domain-containing protein [Usitatibacter sp.]|nr:BON domain-containing protein [Usitatibacter sp.]
MNRNSSSSNFHRSAWAAASLALALAIGAAHGANGATAPEAKSDGMGAALSDTAITAKVKAKTMGESGLERSHIHVTTTNGVVTLEGSASSARAKSAAGEAAKSVDGVKSVDNNLKITVKTRAAAKSRDAVTKTERVASDGWITTKVKSEILASSLAKGFEVSVTTTHGVVVLTGSLASQDAVEHVKDIARKVEGVKSVDVSGLKAAG